MTRAGANALARRIRRVEDARRALDAAWPLLDQAIVSLSTFGLTVVLARGLDQSEYGVFAILVAALMTMQVCVSSLLHYPMSVRIGRSPDHEAAETLRSTFLLLALLLVPLLGVAAAVTVAIGRLDLSGPVVVYFAAWQAQEAVRRGLFARFRHKEAIGGDAVSYVGQFLLVLVLWRSGGLSLRSGLWAMAATSICGAALQFGRLSVPIRGRVALRRVARDYAGIGCWSLLNNLVASVRVMPLLWFLGLSFGPGAAASLQSVLNVINLTNPVMIGLTNILPQAVARAHGRGGRAASAAALPYVAAGTPIVVGFTLTLLAAPGLLLRLVYGSGSAYADLTAELRILTLSILAGYLVEMACAFLHGVSLPRRALIINATGSVATLAFAVPLTVALGLVGTCLALGLGAIVRLAMCYPLVGGLLQDRDQTGSP